METELIAARHLAAAFATQENVTVEIRFLEGVWRCRIESDALEEAIEVDAETATLAALRGMLAWVERKPFSGSPNRGVGVFGSP